MYTESTCFPLYSKNRLIKVKELISFYKLSEVLNLKYKRMC